MKKITLLLSAVLFTVMSFAQSVLFTQTFPGEPSKYTNAYDQEFTVTTGAYTLAYAGINNGIQNNAWTEVRTGSKRFDLLATITSNKVVEPVSKVVVNFTQVDANNTNALYLEVSTTEDFATATKVDATIATGEVAFAIAAPTAELYYRVSIDQKKGSANGFNRFDKVVFYGEGGETPDTPTEPETPDTTGVITCAEALAICLETDTISTTVSYTIRGYVTEMKEAYNSQYKNTTFWMADSVNGGQVLLAFRVKPVVEADQNCKVGDYVEVVGTLINYKGDTPEVNAGGSYTILVAGEGGNTDDPETPDTPTEPETPDTTGVITCAEAVVICETTGSTATADDYKVRGYVTEIKYAWSEQYGTATFWIADTKDGGKVLQAYSCAPLSETDRVFDLGAYVELVGKLKKYNDTNEVERGTYTILVAGEGGETEDPETPETPDVETEGDGTEANPFTVEDVIALNNTLTGKHYVVAYIVGQATGASFVDGLDMEAPFEAAADATQGTNLAIASSMSADTANIIPVQLPKGELRDEFNLVENPGMYGKQVVIYGELVRYFSLPGIKNPESIEVVGATGDDDPDTPSSMITCAQAAAIAAEENYKGTENVTVYGYVVELGNQKTDDETGRMKQCFYLSDNKGGEKQFMAYWAYVPDFFKVDDKVAVTGILQNYQGTIEIADGEAKLLDDTAVDDVFVENIPVKVVKNGQFYIITGDKVYNILGTQVK